MSTAIVCSISAANHLPFARALRSSLKKHNPDIPFRHLLVSSRREAEKARKEGFDLVDIRDFDTPALRRMIRSRDLKQACAALKPVLLLHLLRQGFDSVAFLDPDILVTASLQPLLDEIAQHALTLTGHIDSSFARESGFSRQSDLLLAGMYNGGFLGVSHASETVQFLTWWAQRLETHCVNDARHGLHYDQRWLDFAPGFIGRLNLLRDPGYNLAYWNIQDHEIAFDGLNFHVDGSLLKFFHFSGFDPSRPNQLSIHGAGRRVDQAGPIQALYWQYARMLSHQSLNKRSRTEALASFLSRLKTALVG